MGDRIVVLCGRDSCPAGPGPISLLEHCKFGLVLPMRTSHRQTTRRLIRTADDRIESEVLILQSKSLLLAVADELHLYADPSIAGKSGKGKRLPQILRSRLRL